jgi:IS30 family transposase
MVKRWGLSASGLALAIALQLNMRPRKRFNFKCPMLCKNDLKPV